MNMISIVVPCFNEKDGISIFYTELTSSLPSGYDFEIIFVDDGSIDTTVDIIRKLSENDNRIRLVTFSRNFGKEAATSAGIVASTGKAVIILDADGQHPVELIPKFIKQWEDGNDVVVGVRLENKDEGFVKKYGSKSFYSLFNKITGSSLIPGSTDYRLIDAKVRAAFSKLDEKNRITRGLIDWLGFKVAYIPFKAKARVHGSASYSTKKLVKLALNSFVSLSFTPLYLGGYLGIAITLLSFITGIFVVIEQFILSDPLSLNITGSAMLGILIVFLVGIMLSAQGLMALYISSIYSEVKGRPLFVVDETRSIRP